MQINRRQWLQQAGLGMAAIAALSTTPLSQLFAKPYYNTHTGMWLFNPELEEDPPLKARLWNNENPYGISPKAQKVFQAQLPEANRYAFSQFATLRNAIANYHNVKPENIFISAGSSEILNILAIYAGQKQRSILSAFPTFDPMMNMALAFECDWEKVPLTDTWHHDLPAMEKKVSGADITYICNPNNPTGTLLDPEELKAFCQRNESRTLLVVDEAYNDFLDDPDANTLIPMVRENHKVILLRTMSKIHGFAGLRIGYAIGHPGIVAELEKIRPYALTINGPALQAAIAALQDLDFMQYCRDKNNETKDYSYRIFDELNLPYEKSHTSFISFGIPLTGDQFLKSMRQQGIGMRAWQFKDRRYGRISMGAIEDMELFASALKDVLA
jgi:histidinol-phosphate aminotransferase